VIFHSEFLLTILTQRREGARFKKAKGKSKKAKVKNHPDKLECLAMTIFLNFLLFTFYFLLSGFALKNFVSVLFSNYKLDTPFEIGIIPFVYLF